MSVPLRIMKYRASFLRALPSLATDHELIVFARVVPFGLSSYWAMVRQGNPQWSLETLENYLVLKLVTQTCSGTGPGYEGGQRS